MKIIYKKINAKRKYHYRINRGVSWKSAKKLPLLNTDNALFEQILGLKNS
jgi:hypothetical protein